jgi:hypothetical protein
MIGTNGWDNLIINPSTWQGYPKKFGNSYFYPLSADTYNNLNLLKAWLEVPEVSAVIGVKARSFSNGKVKVIDSKNEEIPDHWLKKLLDNPNWFQDGKELMRQTKIFHDLYGNEYLYKIPFAIKSNPGAKALFTIPSNLIKIEYTDRFPFWTYSEKPKGIVYRLEDYSTIPGDNIIHLNDSKVSVTSSRDDKNILMGESKLLSLRAPVNNIRMAYESRGMIIKYRGAQGIISPDQKDIAGSVPLGEADKDILKKTWGEYGTLAGQSQMAIVDTGVKFQSMTMNEPKKLGLFEETMHDFFRIIDAYGCRREQFGIFEGATYENQNQAEKAFYSDTVIPEANEWIAALNHEFLKDAREKAIIDYSHVHLFAEDIQLKSTALEKMVNSLSKALQDNVITSDEYKEELKKLGIGKTD